MKKTCLLSFIILILASCTDPNTIGLEVTPSSDNIVISSANFSDFYSITESEDSLQTNNAFALLLGEINDPVFGLNKGSFYTQILLTENNIDLGEDPLVDSVVLSYNYSGYYGDITSIDNLEVTQIYQDLYKDSAYYSNSFNINPASMNNVEEFNISENLDNPVLRIKLIDSFGQQILNLGTEQLKDNETFLQEFQGISLLASGSAMLYLNPNGTESYLKIYYSNNSSSSDTLSLDFELGGDAARVSLFNEKDDSFVTEDNTKIFIQSMAGYKAKIDLGNLDQLRDSLTGRVINKATISFDVYRDGLYEPHEELFLSRVQEDGTYIKFGQASDIGVNLFQGTISETDKYEFNITGYLHQLLYNDSYGNTLYLLPAGALVNANRTILEKEITLDIYYSDL